MKAMTAVVLSMLLAGCGVSHQQTATIGAAHGSPVAQPAASPVTRLDLTIVTGNISQNVPIHDLQLASLGDAIVVHIRCADCQEEAD